MHFAHHLSVSRSRRLCLQSPCLSSASVRPVCLFFCLSSICASLQISIALCVCSVCLSSIRLKISINLYVCLFSSSNNASPTPRHADVANLGDLGNVSARCTMEWCFGQFATSISTSRLSSSALRWTMNAGVCEHAKSEQRKSPKDDREMGKRGSTKSGNGVWKGGGKGGGGVRGSGQEGVNHNTSVGGRKGNVRGAKKTRHLPLVR